MGSHIDGTGNISALGSHHRGVDAGEEHLGRHVIAGDRQLNESVASKHQQANLIVGEVIYQILDHHLTTVQTAGRDIPTSIELLISIAIIVSMPVRCSLLILVPNCGRAQHNNQQCQSTLQNPEFYCGAETRHIGHERTQQLGIAKLTQTFLLIAIREKADDGKVLVSPLRDRDM